MADYTKITREQVSEWLTRYDLGKIMSMTPIKGGQANSSIRIDTSRGAFTLSVCDEKSPEQIQCLTRVLACLEAEGFPTTRLVPARNGDGFILHGRKPVYVKGFIKGAVVSTLSRTMLFQVGRTMARLHALPVPQVLPQAFPYGLTAFESLFDIGLLHPYIDWLKEKHAFLENHLDLNMAKGFIHGDIFWDNLLFSNETLVALLDFEEACCYYRLFDIGMCAVGCCAENESFSMDQMKTLMAGYQQIFALGRAEKDQLKYFMAYAAVAASFWRFRQYNVRYPSHEKKDTYLALSTLADQIQAMDAAAFIREVF
jgi:homoserine kinase type II